jgi:hypothetical protein
MPFENARKQHDHGEGRKYVFRIVGTAGVSFGASESTDASFYSGIPISFDKDPHNKISKLIKSLNESASTITRDIEKLIEMQLPENVDVSVSLEFSEGSLMMIGTAILFGINLISGVEGVISFYERVSNIIRVATDNSVRKAVTQRGVRIQENSFNVSVVSPADPPVAANQSPELLVEWLKEQSQLSRVILERQNVIQNDISRLVTLGTILIVALIVLELISIFR